MSISSPRERATMAIVVRDYRVPCYMMACGYRRRIDEGQGRRDVSEVIRVVVALGDSFFAGYFMVMVCSEPRSKELNLFFSKGRPVPP